MFKFNGISSKKMGVIAEEVDFLTRAPIRYSKVLVEGMNGNLYDTENVLEDVEMQFKIQLIKNNYDEVLNWLKGKGTFEFQGRETEVFFFDELHLERKATIKVATVKCIRRSTWYDANDTFKNVSNTFENIGNVVAYPVIKLTASPNSINTVKINDVEFIWKNKINQNIIIDCQKMTEVDEHGNNVSDQLQIGFEYPKFRPGINSISIAGNATLSIKKGSAYL